MKEGENEHLKSKKKSKQINNINNNKIESEKCDPYDTAV